MESADNVPYYIKTLLLIRKSLNEIYLKTSNNYNKEALSE
jgi:hypothetical protein